MEGQRAADVGRALLPRLTGRAVVLAAVGTALWLGSQATASAEEIPPPPAAETTSQARGLVAAPGVELLRPATSAVAAAAPPPASLVAPVADPVSAAVTPTARGPVAPLVPAVTSVAHSVAAPVSDIARPVVVATEPVVDGTTSRREAATPVVVAVQHVAAPLPTSVEQAAALETDAVGPVAGPLRTGMTGALTPVPETGPDQARQPTGTASSRPTPPVHGSAHAGAGVMSPADGGSSSSGPGAAGGPVPTACAGAQSFDHSPADVPAPPSATTTDALLGTGDARDATGDVAFEPSFPPD